MKRHPQGVRGSTYLSTWYRFEVALDEPRIRACVTKTPCQICGSALWYATTSAAHTAAAPATGTRRRRASGPEPQMTARPAIGSAAVKPGSFTAAEAASAAPAANASHGRKRLR